MMMKILEIKSLKKYYGKGANLVKAVDGVDLSIEEGEFVAIAGSSGSGKSTLLHMMGGLDKPTEGKVLIDGKDLYSMNDDILAIFRRRKIGFVFCSFAYTLSLIHGGMLQISDHKKQW
jgi:putative ABC transport system ATP-binding protein